jgi:uncharacterized protein (DUF849 family)
MFLEAALNGGRTADDHPAVPHTPGQLVDATRASIAAGAGAVHFHVRDGDGRESLAATDVAGAVRDLRPLGVPFGVSTGAWIISDPAQRYAAIAEWTALPDFVSINFDEVGAADLAASLLHRGVGVEAAVANQYAAEQLVASGLAELCLRIMFEPREQVVAAALIAVAEAERVLDAAVIHCPRLLHGLNETAWPLLDEAGRQGYDTRIGLEDTLSLPNGSPARDNADLVRAASLRLRLKSW